MFVTDGRTDGRNHVWTLESTYRVSLQCRAVTILIVKDPNSKLSQTIALSQSLFHPSKPPVPPVFCSVPSELRTRTEFFLKFGHIKVRQRMLRIDLYFVKDRGLLSTATKSF